MQRRSPYLCRAARTAAIAALLRIAIHDVPRNRCHSCLAQLAAAFIFREYDCREIRMSLAHLSTGRLFYF